MPAKDLSEHSEVDQQLAALFSNAGAVRAVTDAVQGTLGPKGLDCLLVDEYGGVLLTNDGVTILKTMDVNHPAARVIISAAEHQEEQVGDGTTTATILAGALISEGVNQVIKGVPVTKVIAGINIGIQRALVILKEAVTPLADLESAALRQIAWVAGRERRELAELVVEAAKLLGRDYLRQPGFRLADQVVALERSANELIQGTIVDKKPLNQEMPRQIKDAKLIILDDALEPAKVENDALRTEAGFNKRIDNEKELIANLNKLVELGVTAVFCDRAIADRAEDFLTDHGLIGVQGVPRHEWNRLAQLSGARPIKGASLAKPQAELAKMLGEVAEIRVDEDLNLIKVIGKPGQRLVTIIVCAHTQEVLGERERIVKDAAAAVQAALNGGIVPGGGSIELGIARRLAREPLRGLENFGYQCVVEALKRPLSQICLNAGFNPLEKVEAVLARQELDDSLAIGINCDDGETINMVETGIWDPYFVKFYALKSAGEVCEAILRINTIIKMKPENRNIN